MCCNGREEIREIKADELTSLLKLYTQLHEKSVPEKSKKLNQLWEKILADDNHHIIVAAAGREIVSSCVCVIIPNLTHNLQPYAFIENVVTDERFRKRGLATKCLEYAVKIAQDNDCYKAMLLTGSKLDSTLDFYRRAGFNDKDKTAFIKWL